MGASVSSSANTSSSSLSMDESKVASVAVEGCPVKGREGAQLKKEEEGKNDACPVRYKHPLQYNVMLFYICYIPHSMLIT